jgi:hypothetical protein
MKKKSIIVSVLGFVLVITSIIVLFVFKQQNLDKKPKSNHLNVSITEVQKTKHLDFSTFDMNCNIIDFVTKIKTPELRLMVKRDYLIGLYGNICGVQNSKMSVWCNEKRNVNAIECIMKTQTPKDADDTFCMIDESIRNEYGEPVTIKSNNTQTIYQWVNERGIVSIGINYYNNIIGVVYIDAINSNLIDEKSFNTESINDLDEIDSIINGIRY